MIKRDRSIWAGWFGLLIMATAAPAGAVDFGKGATLGKGALQETPTEGVPVVKVSVVADKTAVVPGGSVDVAFLFEIPDGWHIYWKYGGEGGLETTFDWQLPEGFSAGPMRFPWPKRDIDEIDTQTFILEGEPAILSTLKMPADAKPETTAAVHVTVKWLACKKLCYPGEKTLTLELPIVAEASAVNPANAVNPASAGDFDYARSMLSVAANEAKHLDKIRAAADVDKVKPGAAFKIAVVLDVAKGYHVNSHEPLQKGLVATDVFHERSAGVEIGRAVFPAGKVEEASGEKVSLYRGRTVVVLPVRADGDLNLDVVKFAGVAVYQACTDDTGTCYPPAAVEWSLELPVAKAGEAVAAANAELFGGAGAQTADAASAASTSSSVSGSPSRTWLQRVQDRLIDLGLVGYIILALLGGFILNLMPCVLPVISIKVLSFVQQAKESRLRVFTLGSAFSAGILLSFVVLGLLIVGTGQQWGGLFQSPWVVIALCAIVTAFALSLFGVWALFPPRIVNELGEKVQREGHASAFGMGLLATLLGTACTAPFLSVVIALTVKVSATVGMLIFVSAGVGMAFPYVLLAAKPAWLRFVPRPGPWMGVFERVVGFLLLATVVFLLNTLAAEIGGSGLVWALVFLLCVAVAAWLYGMVEYGAASSKKMKYYGGAVLVLIGGWVLSFQVMSTIPQLLAGQRSLRLGIASSDLSWDGSEIPWVPYTRQRAAAAIASGKTVFIDYTAEWCINCKVNEKLVLDTPEVRAAMRRLEVMPFKADFTSFDAEIKADLARHGKSGVPMYVVYPAGKPDSPIVLDELLTKAAMIGALEQAGPSVGVGKETAELRQ